MAKQFKKAIVTYNGGLSYQFRGKLFKQNRSMTVTDEKLALALRKKKDFSVQVEYTETEAPKPAAKPVKKTKRKAAGGDE